MSEGGGAAENHHLIDCLLLLAAPIFAVHCLSRLVLGHSAKWVRAKAMLFKIKSQR